MKTFADWLHFYNNLDVELFLDALESIRDFYTGLGILLFIDAFDGQLADKVASLKTEIVGANVFFHLESTKGVGS